MVLGRQTELSGQLVIKFYRNHPETSFLWLQLPASPFLSILEGVEVESDLKFAGFA